MVIAKNLLDMRKPQSDVAKATGLPIDEVRRAAAPGAAIRQDAASGEPEIKPDPRKDETESACRECETAKP